MSEDLKDVIGFVVSATVGGLVVNFLKPEVIIASLLSGVLYLVYRTYEESK
jgi:hypothetical protein